MSFSERVRRIENRFYSAIRHPAAAEAVDLPLSRSTLRGAFDGHEYCLLVSYRRSGEAVPTPVWFALDGDRLVFESDADSLKLKRIGRDPQVRVAPCTARGRPLSSPLAARARTLEGELATAAERALDEKYGRTRRATQRLRPTPAAGHTYVAVSLSPSGGPST